MTTLYVVPSERHVERLARERRKAETRASLRSRLAAALLPDARFVDRREARLALSIALEDGSVAGRGRARQLDLFGGGAPAAGSTDDILAPMRRGGASWVRVVTAIDAAITLVRARGATVDDLERVARRGAGVASARARLLAGAIRALDETLSRAGARDERLLGHDLAGEIARAEPEALAHHLGARAIAARWLFGWEPSDTAWWRAVDEGLSRLGGSAKVFVPVFERPLEGARERDPLEAVAEDLAGGLDAAPEFEPIGMVLGDLAGAPPPPEPLDRVGLVQVQDPAAQARAVRRIVSDALDAGAAIERIALCLPVLDERTLAPLRRELDEAGIVTHEAKGPPPSDAPVVAAAFLSLAAAASCERRAVARLFGSGYVDAPRLLDGVTGLAAARAASSLARALEATATRDGPTVEERLVATASAGKCSDDGLALLRAFVEASRDARAPSTRGAHIRAARSTWAALGIGARAGRGGLATFSRDEPPTGIARAERLAIARDSRAWEALMSALDDYERVTRASGAEDVPTSSEVFRLELAQALDEAGARPGAGRAGAIRIAPLFDVAGEQLDLLVVVDANEGMLPRDIGEDAVVSDALAASLARIGRGAAAAVTRSVARARELASLACAASEAKRIVLAFPAEDGAGSPLSPSPVVDVLRRAGAAVVPCAPAAAPVRRAARVGEDVALRAERERVREGFFLDPRRPASDLVADLSRDLRGEVAAILAAATGAGDRALSVTALERFARCPFAGLAHVVYASREAERSEELPDAREEGLLVHEALAAAFTATRARWPERPRRRDDIASRGLAAADEVIARAERHAPLSALVRMRVREAVSLCLGHALDETGWDFGFAEQPFGARSDASWPSLSIEDGGARLSLRGTIDRIDRSHDGARMLVIDYKRSKTTVRASVAGLGESALQVPLYACVASRRFDVDATGRYVPTQPRDLATPPSVTARAEQRMQELVARPAGGALAEIERRALAVVCGVRSGVLTPTPIDESICRTCAASGACRKPRFAMAPADEPEEDAS